ncbi:MAG: hypothetical protein SFU25_10795 [Candidatus Caenarcaniphilales bacterium]|nr:hypothetical protein [Candidatus Caenarcaniphilales bacterium]
MIPVQGSNQSLNKNFSNFAGNKSVAASTDLMNQSNQSSRQSYSPSQGFDAAVNFSDPTEKRARATNILNNKFYGTGGSLDVYA